MHSQVAKDRIFRLAGRSMRSWPIERLVRGFFKKHINIIFYHGVWENGCRRKRIFTGIELDAFEAELRILKKYFRFIPLGAMLESIEEYDRSSKPVLSVTFDDGFDLTSSGATAVMDMLSISATTFVNTASVHYLRPMWRHLFTAIIERCGHDLFIRKFNQLQACTSSGPAIETVHQLSSVTKRWPMRCKDEYAESLWKACDMPPMDEFLAEHRPYFDWDGLKDWIDRGHAVGFHTHSHPFCSRLEQSDIEVEILTPLTELRDKLNLQSVPFAYPFGDRFPDEYEKIIAATQTFSCLLGTGASFSTRLTPPDRLSRIEAEGDIDIQVFGRPVLRALKGSD